jgi:hypothetical protein
VTEAFSLTGVGDVVAVAVGEAETFVLLLARFVGSTTHPITSTQFAMKSIGARYRFILFTPPISFPGGLIWQGACRVEDSLRAFRFFFAPLREIDLRPFGSRKGAEKNRKARRRTGDIPSIPLHDKRTAPCELLFRFELSARVRYRTASGSDRMPSINLACLFFSPS